MARVDLPAALLAALLSSTAVLAHDGPPYPIVSNQIAGAYAISIWTDPDATDDGTAEGKFWVLVDPADGSTGLPAGTAVSVAVRPLDRGGPELVGDAAPVKGDLSNQFAALLMDHEGRFAVRVAVEGPLGRVELESVVDATYDLRPAPALVIVYALPFVALGTVWLKMLLRRRRRKALSSRCDEETRA